MLASQKESNYWFVSGQIAACQWYIQQWHSGYQGCKFPNVVDSNTGWARRLRWMLVALNLAPQEIAKTIPIQVGAIPKVAPSVSITASH